MRGKKMLVLVACVLAAAVPAGASVHTEEPFIRNGESTQEWRGEKLTLRCRWFDYGGGGVGCDWSQSKSRDFAQYQLARASQDDYGTVVFSSRERAEVKAVDRDVKEGRYVYFVRVLDANGKLIGHSNRVEVRVGRPSPGEWLGLPSSLGLPPWLGLQPSLDL